VSKLIVETSAAEPPPGFRADPSDLLAFLSFAAAERYGSVHPLSGAAALLRKRHLVDMTPLLVFNDAVPEDDEDRRELERLWQEPAPLAAAARDAATAIRTDAQITSLVHEFPALPDRLDDLAGIARWAAERNASIRLTYRL